MKKYALLHAISFLTFTSAIGQSTLVNVYGHNENDYANDFAVYPSDSSIYLTGTSALQTHPGFVMKLDAQGDTLWTIRLNYTGSDVTGRIIKVSNDNNILVGGTYIDGSSNWNTFLYKIDTSGTKIWCKKFTDNNLGTLDQGYEFLLEDSGGNIYFLSRTSISANYRAIVITKVDPNGTMLWQKYIDAADEVEVNEALLYDDSTIYLIGNTEAGASLQKDDVFILKLDNNANLLWSKTISSLQYDYGYHISKTANGDLLIAYMINGLASVSRYDNSGNELWTRAYLELPSNYVMDFRYCDEQANGDIMIGGLLMEPNNEYPMFFRITSAGTPIGGITYKFPVASFVNIRPYKYYNIGNSYYFNGYKTWSEFGKTDIFLVKTDLTGNTFSCIDSSFNHVSLFTPSPYNTGTPPFTMMSTTGSTSGNLFFNEVDTVSFPYHSYMPPVVSLSAFSNDTLCTTDSPEPLPVGSPSGGVYSGAGVSGSNWDPSQSGAGSFYLVYTYADTSNCQNSDSTLITVENCVGINDITDGSELSVFPNPTDGYFTVSGIKGKVQYEITSVTGQVIHRGVTEKSTIQLDLSDFQKGIYLLKLKGENITLTRSIIKK